MIPNTKEVVKKTDIDIRLGKISNRSTSNKTKHEEA